jgi:beta-phosphoglucomutase family hydrolase
MNKQVTPEFDAVIFDLDGVITKTAVTHTKAWKKTFDSYLQVRAKREKIPFEEFTPDDYLNYVDGKPRYKGVSSFLKSRNINLPWGTPEDPPSKETVYGLGNRKNEAFLEILNREGAEVYPSSKTILLELDQCGVKLGVASSSKNCKAVLEAVGLDSLFKARVDGVLAAEMNLKGKPEPDIFIKACEMLNAEPSQSIVVEDAVSGVRAGANGNFGLTLGIARKNNSGQLQKNGADYVISDFSDIKGAVELNALFIKFRKK